jgi:hypothetical protein
MIKKYLITLGVLVMCISCGCSDGFKYSRYSSKIPELNITMDYIDGWSVDEQRGSYNTFVQALFLGPVPKDGTNRAIMALTLKPKSKVPFKPLTVEGLEKDILAKRMNYRDAKLIESSNTKTAGEPARELLLTYKALDKIYDLRAKLVPTKERIIIFEKNDNFYILRYENAAIDFDKYDRAFSHIAKSLRFK